MTPPPDPARPSSRPVLLWLLGLTLALTGAHVATWDAAASGSTAADDTAVAADARTWVVDALDDELGARWRSADTGTTTTRIAVGDAVEWRFDQAQVDHDLTSATDSPSPWPTPVAVFKRPGDPPYRMSFDRPGTYTYLCSIHGQTMSGRIVVEEAGQVNQPPVVDPMVGRLSGTAPLAVSVMAHASDPDGDPLTYLWDFGTGDPADRATFEDPSFVYSTPGFYTLSLRVADDRGGVVERSWPVSVGGGTGAPTVRATATPATGPSPLPVAFTAEAYDAQGGSLSYAWDFGVDGATDTASTASATWTYATPGTYVATLSVTDDGGHVGVDTVEVTVTDATDGTEPLPEVRATVSPQRGSRVARFSTEVTTRGELRSYAEGLETDPALTGTATVSRRRGATTAAIEVTGLRPGAFHEQVHVHEQSCAEARAGAHFRFDESQPFGADNEIWLPFTADAAGRSGRVEVTQPQRAGAKAVAIVVHDPANPARRIGCADLAPTTAGLTYAWDFGDGTTGAGPDPDHAYARDGRYAATVTVTGPPAAGQHPGHGTGHGTRAESVTSTVTVVVDATAPQTRIVAGPVGAVRSGRSRFDLASTEPGSTFACRLDGGAWTPCAAATRPVVRRQGAHTLQVRATDRAGNTDRTPAVRRWTVDSTAPEVGAVRPTATTRDRTPSVVARVADRGSGVRAVALQVDGRRAPARYRAGTVSWTPQRALAVGRHTVRLTVVDAAGNRAVRTWRFRVG